MSNQLQKLAWMISVALVLINPPVLAEDTQKPISKISQLSDIKQPATSIKQWLAQSLIQITGVKSQGTDKGIEIILETNQSDQLQLTNKSEGNNYIIDIPNTQLRLLSGDTFHQEKPTAGIAEVTVSNLDANTIRVTVIGETGAPQVELFDGDEGLIFGVVPTVTTTQRQQTQATPVEPQPSTEIQPEQPSAQNEEPIELVVTGEQGGYRAEEASTATKTDTPIRDIPQSIQVIPREVLKDQGIIRVQDALRNVSGSTSTGYYQGFSEYFSLRGFDANLFRDGLRLYNDFGGLTETANIERIEVLKGPASVLFGDAPPGGLVNLVTKQPFPEPFYSFEGRVGSFSNYRGAFDLSGPLTNDKNILYRFNALYENAGSFRDFVNSERVFLAPIFKFALGTNTNLTIEGSWLEEKRTTDDGTVAIGNRPANLPRSRFLGEPFQNVEINVTNFSYLLDHKFSDQWSIRNAFRAQFVNLERYFPLRDSLDEETGELSRLSYFSQRRDNAYSLQTDVVGKFNTGSIKHQLVLGFDYTKITEDGTFGDFEAYPSINIFNPVYARLEYPKEEILTFFRDDSLDKYGFYFQDQIEVTPQLKLLAGGRFDIFDQTRSTRNLGEAKQESSQSDTNFSPRLGIVYQPSQNISLYASYATSFVPVFDAGRNATGEPFKPETGRQFEVGVKADITRNLSATLALYDLRKQNVATDDPNSPDPNEQIQTAEQTSRGIEFDIAGEITPGWKVIASYSYIDAFVSKDNNGFEGQRRDNIPEHAASLWTTYEFQQGSLQGLGFGLGLFFVGDRFGDLDNSFVLPSFVRTDASVFYKRNNWRAAVNVRNLFDETYYTGSAYGSRLEVYYGEPLTVIGSFAIEF
ncbi:MULTISPECIES: TonB-dependent siderophore receptor [Nostoc]|uniref:TonB-dependent siderophore receptor n=2 Tax=Nostoc TaxID=1177 RepID=A0ABR8IJM0_9NOSO|nr:MULTISPECIES: TonB-dependent siderophore receptor [Nostoc]MBD2566095.1 TonB-dependent siderophore receptor [Nostoc linckia FACHB-391]MBD2651698.1 TonB-dependent siderophore receptor [Nostoc foliaceum FACHB-393]